MSPSYRPANWRHASPISRYQNYFVSEATVYRLLKAHDLITSPAFIVIKAADEFKDKTTAVNQLWQTDFTYLKVIGWGWFYLSTILDDFSRYIIAWKLCTTMKAEDVTDTLQRALAASGCDQARVILQPLPVERQWVELRLRRSRRMARTTTACGMCAARPTIRKTQGKIERWHLRRSRAASCSKTTTCPAIWNAPSPTSSSTTITAVTPKSLKNLTPADVAADMRPNHPAAKRKDRKRDFHPETTIAAANESRLTFNLDGPEPPLDHAANCLKAFDDGQAAPFRETEAEIGLSR